MKTSNTRPAAVALLIAKVRVALAENALMIAEMEALGIYPEGAMNARTALIQQLTNLQIAHVNEVERAG